MARSPRWISSLFALALSVAAPTAYADLGPARESFTRGDYPAAEQALRAATGAERAEADRLLGRVLMETGRYTEAKQLGEQMARNAAGRVEGLTLQGEALAAVGEYEQAVQKWTQAVNRNQLGVGRRARALGARWLQRMGRMDDARDLVNPLVDEYNDAVDESQNHPAIPGRPNPKTAILRDAEGLMYLGMGMRVLGAFQDANQAFEDSRGVDPRNVELLIESAELYLSKEDMANAGSALREALAVNPNHARALALRARTRLANDLDFVKAEEDLTAAEKVNPKLPEVFSLRAQIVLRDEDIARATALNDQALAINPKSLEGLAVKGVIRYDANDMNGFRAAFDELFRVSPTYVEAYDLLGEFADWEHRYEEAATLMREGLQRPGVAADRKLQGAMRALLGINLLRMGDEEHGLGELNDSFNLDRYNVRVANLLNLYENTIVPEYETQDIGPFRIRYHKSEKAVLMRYVPQLLQRAYDDMVARYKFTPVGPLSIELYADTEHFSVRTSGLPELGVQGVCFGKVITAISPKGGPFNWGQILWHELGHVFAIQLSRSRVPRWFTEGLSEWEAFHSHPEWSREDDRDLYNAMKADKIPHVADFNTAFTHARSGGAVLTAYYAASKLVEFMIDKYGFDKVAALLPLWAQGLDTREVIRRGLGLSAEDLDKQFRDFTTQRLQKFANQYAVDEASFSDHDGLVALATAQPRSELAQASAAMAEMVAGNADEAARYAQAALALNPRCQLAHWVLAQLALEGRDGRKALEHIDAILSTGLDSFELRTMEARAARAARDNARMLKAVEGAVRQDSSQAEAWGALVQIYEEAGRKDDQLRALREVVKLDQHDREALEELIDQLVQRNAWADIRALLDHARMLNPESGWTHMQLGRALAEGGQRDDAIYEYESALLIEDTGVPRAAPSGPRAPAQPNGRGTPRPGTQPQPNGPTGNGGPNGPGGNSGAPRPGGRLDPHPAVLPPAMRADVYVALAKLFQSANQRSRAQDAIRNAVRLAPTNAEARTLATQLGVR